MKYHVVVGSHSFVIDVLDDGVRIDGRDVEVDFSRLTPRLTHSLVVDGASYRVRAEREDDATWHLGVHGATVRATVVDERTKAIREMAGVDAAGRGPAPIKAPMPGLIVRVEVEEGDQVQEGQGIVIVEAMKMENELVADSDAVVRAVHVAQGDAVTKGQVLVDLAPLSEEGDEA